jgi:hypothetical protein
MYGKKREWALVVEQDSENDEDNDDDGEEEGRVMLMMRNALTGVLPFQALLRSRLRGRHGQRALASLAAYT